jgi:hypothetical protein
MGKERRSMAFTEEMAEERPAERCRWGCATETPCPRPRAEHHERLCLEHAKARELVEDWEDGWFYAINRLEEWLQEAREEDPKSHLVEIMTKALDDAERNAQLAGAKAKGAMAAACAYKESAA